MVSDSRIDRSEIGEALTARAPAKLNLALSVRGRRVDGFHDIQSLVLVAELFDELEFEWTKTRAILLRCDPEWLPAGPENLVVRAALALVGEQRQRCGASISLRKRIPIAAGLGGGSSDAAMTLAALNRLWGLEHSTTELAEIGAGLGSDVALFFAMPSAIMTGRGEKVTPVSLAWSGWVALAFGEWPVSTQEAYARWRADDHQAGSEDALAGMIEARSAAELTPLLFNELEAAVYRTVPEVEVFHQRLRRDTGHGWRLTGAGATAFALFDEEGEARAAVAEVEQQGLAAATEVVRTARGSMDDCLRRDDRWRYPKHE